MAFPGGDEENVPRRGEKSFIMLKTPLADKASPWPQAPHVEVELRELYLCGCLERVPQTFEDMWGWQHFICSETLMLWVFIWKTRMRWSWGIWLLPWQLPERFGKSTHATWIRFFDEGDGRNITTLWRHYVHTFCYMLASDSEDGLDLYVFPLAILTWRGKSYGSLALPGVLIRMVGQVHGQRGLVSGEIRHRRPRRLVLPVNVPMEWFFEVASKLVEHSEVIMEEEVCQDGLKVSSSLKVPVLRGHQADCPRQLSSLKVASLQAGYKQVLLQGNRHGGGLLFPALILHTSLKANCLKTKVGKLV